MRTFRRHTKSGATAPNRSAKVPHASEEAAHGLRRPLPDGVFDHIAAAYAAHDDTCASLPEFWLGRTGGVSAFGEQGPCADCHAVFHNEGLVSLTYTVENGPAGTESTTDDDEPELVHLCACCAVGRGYRLRRGRLGFVLAHDIEAPPAT